MSIGALPFSLRDVVTEIYGVGYSGSKSLVDCSNDASPTVGTLPTSLSDFASHTQDWGRMYSLEAVTLTPYIQRKTETTYYLMNSTETLEFTGDRDENCAVYKSGTGTAIVSGDAVRLRIYRRTKQTTDSWVLDTTHTTYISTILYACVFTVYDYRFYLDATP